ncbi:MAG: hypothetical protein H0U92_13860 [Actinobacteria bacterium]|nr:hypothetical protein [Actinomycetota bacterium]
MSRPVSKFLSRLGREPAALGDAALAWFAVADPSPAVMAAATATIVWLIRSFSTSKAKLDDVKQDGYNAPSPTCHRSPSPHPSYRHHR